MVLVGICRPNATYHGVLACEDASQELILRRPAGLVEDQMASWIFAQHSPSKKRPPGNTKVAGSSPNTSQGAVSSPNTRQVKGHQKKNCRPNAREHSTKNFGILRYVCYVTMCSGIVDYLSEFSDLQGSMGNVGRGSIGHVFTVGSTSHMFTVGIQSDNRNQASFHLFGPQQPRPQALKTDPAQHYCRHVSAQHYCRRLSSHLEATTPDTH